MADELPKKSPTSEFPPSSDPPPPTDEIDEDWGTPARSAPTHAAPKASDEEDTEDEEEDDEADDEEEDEDDEEEADDEEEDEDDMPRSVTASHPSSGVAHVPSREDSLPDWVPWVVLAALVGVGIAGALGAFSGF